MKKRRHTGVIILITILLLLGIGIVLFFPFKYEGFASENPIDVVYTWVNTYDEEWKNQRKKYLPMGYFDDPKRNVNTKIPWEEIEFSIRSVRKNLPWIRDIIIVTERPQKMPEDLNKELRVRYVHHDEFMPKSALPTYSSVAIETMLHKIPGLSDKFLYFNDDMYINRPMERGHFFKGPDQLPIFRINATDTYKLKTHEPTSDLHINMMKNHDRLLKGKFFIPWHQAKALNKKVMETLWRRFPKEMNDTLHRKFRNVADISSTYMAYNVNPELVTIINPYDKDDIQQFYANETEFIPYDFSQFHMICINGGDPAVNELYRNEITRQLR